MKKLINLVLIISIFSNCNQPIRQNRISDSKIPDIVKAETKQAFPEYFFKIDCPCILEKEFFNGQEKYYTFRCHSTSNETIYAISIKNLEEDLNGLNNRSSKDYYKSEFLKEYEKNLRRNQIEYKNQIIYGFNAIEYSVPAGDIIHRQAIFVSGNFAYTLSVTSNTAKIDSVFNNFSKSFELFFKSDKYLYYIEIPKGFYQGEIIGKNVDFKYGNEKGNSIVIVVKKLLPQEQGMTSDDLLKIPNSDWETNLQMPNVMVKKKGVVNVDNQNGMFLHYTSKDDTKPYTLFYTNYLFVYQGFLYNLTATCEDTELSEMQPIFFRALHSFKFPM